MKAEKSKKIILIGHYGVGKTSLIRRFVHQLFDEKYHSTIGVKIDKKVIEFPEANITLIIWDIEGSEDHRKLPKSYFIGAHGLVFVCDLTRPATWENAAERIKNMQELSPGVRVRTAGNKSDLISGEDLERLLSEMEFEPEFLTSAKEGRNVDALFRDLAKEFL